MDVVSGSCLCGEIEYEVRGVLGKMGHCHCGMCQKAHGAAYATYINVAEEDFKFTKGETQLTVFQSSSNVERTFCKTCGSNLQFRRPGKSRFGITVGTLDGTVSRTPDHEIWTSAIPIWGSREGIPLRHETEHKQV